MHVTADDARDAIARSAQTPVDTLEQRIRAALIALQATYASRCGEPTLGWGWRLVATSARHVGGGAKGGRDAEIPGSVGRHDLGADLGAGDAAAGVVDPA